MGPKHREAEMHEREGEETNIKKPQQTTKDERTRMRTTSQKINRLCKRLIAAAALPAVVAMFGTVSAFAGAIFTTDLNCEKVNGNIYNTKQDVYLNGGPDGMGSALDPLTTYCVRVSAPGGIADLNPTT